MAGDIAAYGGLFAVAFLAATILPAQSEIGLAGLLLSGDYSVALLIAVASLGNTLGAVVNWALGRWIEHFRDGKWFPAKPDNAGFPRPIGHWRAVKHSRADQALAIRG